MTRAARGAVGGKRESSSFAIMGTYRRSVLERGGKDQTEADRLPKQKSSLDPIERVVALGYDEDATFFRHPDDHVIWIRKGQTVSRMPYFSPAGRTDEELAERIGKVFPSCETNRPGWPPVATPKARR